MKIITTPLKFSPLVGRTGEEIRVAVALVRFPQRRVGVGWRRVVAGAIMLLLALAVVGALAAR